jgi:hypothetical protein
MLPTLMAVEPPLWAAASEVLAAVWPLLLAELPVVVAALPVVATVDRLSVGPTTVAEAEPELAPLAPSRVPIVPVVLLEPAWPVPVAAPELLFAIPVFVVVVEFRSVAVALLLPPPVAAAVVRLTDVLSFAAVFDDTIPLPVTPPLSATPVSELVAETVCSPCGLALPVKAVPVAVVGPAERLLSARMLPLLVAADPLVDASVPVVAAAPPLTASLLPVAAVPDEASTPTPTAAASPLVPGNGVKPGTGTPRRLWFPAPLAATEDVLSASISSAAASPLRLRAGPVVVAESPLIPSAVPVEVAAKPVWKAAVPTSVGPVADVTTEPELPPLAPSRVPMLPVAVSPPD